MDAQKYEAEIKQISVLFEQKESDETWLKFDSRLQLLIQLCPRYARLPGFTGGIRRIKQGIVNSVLGIYADLYREDALGSHEYAARPDAGARARCRFPTRS